VAVGLFVVALRWMMKRTDGKPVTPVSLDREYEDGLFEFVMSEIRKAEQATPRQTGSVLLILQSKARGVRRRRERTVGEGRGPG